MSSGTIVSVVIYAFLALALIIGFLIGFKRGLVKSSVRFGTFIVLILVAGFISTPIANALSTIDISGLNIVVGGTVAKTLPNALKNLIFSNSIMEGVAESSPSTVALVEKLPTAILSLAVFFVLVILMTLISYFVYLIINRALPEKKVKIGIKKLKKHGCNNPHVYETEQKKLVQIKKKRKAWLGGAVGVVQGFVFLFVLLLPVTSLVSTVSDITTTKSIDAVYADSNEDEFLSETSGDLLTYYLGEDIVSAINGYGKSVPGMALTLGGLDDAIFDSLTNINVNGENFEIREDLVSIAKIYDQYVYLVDEIGKAESYSTVDFEKINKIIDTLFEMGIVKSLAPELLPYALDYFYSTETFNSLDYKTEIEYVLNGLVEDLKNNPEGFLKTLRTDFAGLIEIGKTACETGYVDDLMGGKREISDLMIALQREDYGLLNSLTQNLFETPSLKNVLPRATNSLLTIVEKMNNNEVDFVEISTENLNWETFEQDANAILKNVVNGYLILDQYEIEKIFNDFKTISKDDFKNEDFAAVLYLFGNEIQLIKDSELFVKQQENPYTTFVNYFANKDEFKDVFNPDVLNNANWNHEFSIIVPSLVSLKDSGVMEYFLTYEEIDEQAVCDMFLETEDENTYLYNVVSGLYDSSITKKPLSFVVNSLNDEIEEILSDEINSVTISKIEESKLTQEEKDSTINVVEHLLKSYSVVTKDDFSFENLTDEEIEKVGSFLNSLKENSFKYSNNEPNPSCTISQDGKSVDNGGIFSEVYIAMIDFAKKSFSFEGNVSYGTINWVSFLKTSKKLSELDEDELLEILAGEDEDIDVGEVLEVLGADEETVESIENVKDSFAELDPENPDSFKNLSDSLESLDDDKIQNIIDSVKESTEEEIEIDTSLIEKEKIISKRISLLMTSEINDENMAESLSELCNGATLILNQSISKGVVIECSVTGGLEKLEEEIEKTTKNLIIQDLVKQLFGIE